MSRTSVLFPLSVLLAVLGCSPQDELELTDDPIGEARSSIAGGAEDTSHSAVASLSTAMERCTATIFSLREDRGAALTAAHCCQAIDAAGAELGVGADVLHPDLVLPVTDFMIDRAYDELTHDFCVLAFTAPPGTAGALSVIPLLTPEQDQLAAGDELEFVGYGDTLNGEINTLRRHLSLPLDTVDALAVHYDESAGGPCGGDSGGPGLVTVDGVERVAAVIAHGSNECRGEGTSGRVSAVHQDLIAPFLAGQPQRISCRACAAGAASRVGACAAPRDECLSDPDCAILAKCHGGCTTDACRSSCDAANPAGRSGYLAISACVGEECADVCGEDALCETAPEPASGCAVTRLACGPRSGVILALVAAGMLVSRLRRRRTARSQKSIRPL